MLMWRTSSKSEVEPSTTTSRFSAPCDSMRGTDGQRRDALTARLREDRLRIVQRDVARDLPEQHAGTDARRFGAPRQHDHQVGAERGELIDHIAARALAQRGEHHHRRHADGHRQHHQQRARRTAAQTAGGELEGVGELSCAEKLNHGTTATHGISTVTSLSPAQAVGDSMLRTSKCRPCSDTIHCLDSVRCVVKCF